MKDGVKDIVGKTISGIVVGESKACRQVFLIFSDNTHFEFYGGGRSFTGAGGVDSGGIEHVRKYIMKFPETCIKAEYVSADDQRDVTSD